MLSRSLRSLCCLLLALVLAALVPMHVALEHAGDSSAQHESDGHVAVDHEVVSPDVRTAALHALAIVSPIACLVSDLALPDLARAPRMAADIPPHDPPPDPAAHPPTPPRAPPILRG